MGKGKAGFKHEIAIRKRAEVASLPFRADLLEWLQIERAKGRRLVLTTASDRLVADEVAQRLNLFDEIIASDGHTNLSGENKRLALVARFGERGFDYVGNEAKDEAVWKSSRVAVVVGGDSVVNGARSVAEVSRVFPVKKPTLRVWVKAVRLHQWIKNVLIFLPALLAHSILKPAVLSETLLAFLSYGLCASSVYLVNDLFDLASDRRHPRKRARAFASGALSARAGVIAALLLLTAAAALAVSVNLYFCGVLVGYYFFTWAYSLRLKGSALIDVMMLTGLYTLRIIAGSAATMIPPSFWLLAFSVLLFLSLGIVKRYAELEDARIAGKAGGHGRGYTSADLPLLMSLGTSAGYCAVLVTALYINSPDSQMLYKHNKPLWLICPLMLFWISRIWLLTSRGQMHDDPIVFAIRDHMSLLILLAVAAVVVVST
jgi:4-hydroxybenzoate polyprenyltransferase